MQTTEISWQDQMVRKLQINGKSERTQEAYTRAVRQLKEHYKKDPALMSEDELDEYFLYRRNESQWAPKTLRLCYYGIKFYYQAVLDIQWNLFLILKAQKEERLPEIPTKETIHKVLAHVTTFHNFVFFSTVYSCGLRLQEALNLQVSDIDSGRMMVYVHRGKCAKDRYVPLPLWMASGRTRWRMTTKHSGMPPTAPRHSGDTAHRSPRPSPRIPSDHRDGIESGRLRSRDRADRRGASLNENKSQDWASGSPALLAEFPRTGRTRVRSR